MMIGNVDGAVVGLSPLARGNQRLDVLLLVVSGPIPARAGEPLRVKKINLARRAYPRSRGGTGDFMEVTESPEGLSPLARGNQEYGAD